MNAHRWSITNWLAAQGYLHAYAANRRVVAARYGVSRDAMDEYGFQSQERTAAAHAAGKFEDEIVPVTCEPSFMTRPRVSN